MEIWKAELTWSSWCEYLARRYCMVNRKHQRLKQGRFFLPDHEPSMLPLHHCQPCRIFKMFINFSDNSSIWTSSRSDLVATNLIGLRLTQEYSSLLSYARGNVSLNLTTKYTWNDLAVKLCKGAGQESHCRCKNTCATHQNPLSKQTRNRQYSNWLPKIEIQNNTKKHKLKKTQTY